MGNKVKSSQVKWFISETPVGVHERTSMKGHLVKECGLFNGHCNGLQSKCKADSRGIVTVHKVSLRPVKWVL